MLQYCLGFHFYSNSTTILYFIIFYSLNFLPPPPSLHSTFTLHFYIYYTLNRVSGITCRLQLLMWFWLVQRCTSVSFYCKSVSITSYCCCYSILSACKTFMQLHIVSGMLFVFFSFVIVFNFEL